MFSKPFQVKGVSAHEYAYQTVRTPDPYDGTPIYSLLLLSLADHVATRYTILYDISRDAAQAEAYRRRLVQNKIPPGEACQIVSRWLEEPLLI